MCSATQTMDGSRVSTSPPGVIAQSAVNHSSCGVGIVDTLFKVLVLGPAIVTFWRGVWLLQDEYLLPGDIRVSAGLSVAIGVLSTFLYFIAQPWLNTERALSSRGGLSRVVTYAAGWGSVSFWRGVWLGLDELLLSDDTAALGLEVAAWVTTMLGVVLLLGSLTWRSMLDGVVQKDAEGGALFNSWWQALRQRRLDLAFLARLRDEHTAVSEGRVARGSSVTFSVTPQVLPGKGKAQTKLLLIDVPLTILVVGLGVVGFWRGVWTLLDIHVLPDDFAASAYVCWLGATLLALPHIAMEKRLGAWVLQRCISGQWSERRLQATERLKTGFFGVVGVAYWRGVWYLLDHWTTPALSVGASALVTHIIATTILLLGSALRSVVLPPFGIACDDCLSCWLWDSHGPASSKLSPPLDEEEVGKGGEGGEEDRVGEGLEAGGEERIGELSV